MNVARILPVAAVATSVALYGCATEPVTKREPIQESRTPASAKTTQATATARQTRPSSGTRPQSRSAAAATATPSDPAVVALLATAQQQANGGELAAAAASLERALRIEPKNSWTWYRLGVVRFRQGQLGLAEQFARKSEALAGTDADIRARSWRLIALVRESQGDYAGARAARETAKLLGP